MATVEKRTNGTWRGRYRCDGSCKPNGKCTSHTKGCTAPTKREALKKAKALEHAASLNAHTASVNAATTLAEAGALFLASDPENVKDSTMSWYGDILSAFANKFPTYAATPVNKITTAHIDAILRKVRDENRKAATIRGYRNVLSFTLGYSRRSLKLITENPCDDATLPKATNAPREVKWFTEEELWAMAEAITPRYKLLVLLGGFCGLRIGELSGLKVSDIERDAEDVSLHIQRQYNRKGEYAPTKTSKDGEPPKTRYAPVFRLENPDAEHDPTEEVPNLVTLLDQHLTEYPDSRDGTVFSLPNGAPINYRNFLKREWTPALERAGLTHRGTHSMRRCFVTLALDRGLPVEDVADFGGWDDVRQVYNVYRGKNKKSNLHKHAHLMATPNGVTTTASGTLEQGADALAGIVTASVDTLTAEITVADALHPDWTTEAVAS